MTSGDFDKRARGVQPVPGGRTKVLPRILVTLLGIAAAIAFFIFALLSSIELVVYGIPGYFPHEFEKYDVYADLPVKAEDVDRVMSETMEYLRGDRDRLEDVTARIDGAENVPFYNDSEISHMSDVRVLFIKGLRLRNTLAVLLLICAGALVIAAGRKKGLWTFAVTELALIGISIGTAIYASTDFTRFFTMFHRIFFPQGNWEFDPARSRMINMLPEGLFSDTAMYIVIVWALAEAAVTAAAWHASRRRRKSAGA